MQEVIKMTQILGAAELEECGVDVSSIYGEMPKGCFGDITYHVVMRETLMTTIQEVVKARQDGSDTYADKLLTLQKMYFYLQSEYDCEDEDQQISDEMMADLTDLRDMCVVALLLEP